MATSGEGSMPMFWAVIKCNLRDPGAVGEFNAWYNGQHAPRYIVQPGFRRGWRLERFDQAGQRGQPGQRFLAIYEVDSVAAFNAALERDLAVSHPWEQWETRIQDWQRTYYRNLLTYGGVQPERGNKGRSGLSSVSISIGLKRRRSRHSTLGTTIGTFPRSAALPVLAAPGG